MFEWDEEKRNRNVEKHGIDFVRAKEIWDRKVIERPSPQPDHGEARHMAIGLVDGVCVTVIYTWREEKRRIISARKARKNEKEDYNNEAW